MLQAILEDQENVFANKFKAISYEMPAQLSHLFEQAEIDAGKLLAFSEFDFLSFIRIYSLELKDKWSVLRGI